MVNLSNIVEGKHIELDQNGIYVNTKLHKQSDEADDIKVSKSAWTKIYNFNQEKLKQDRQDFNENKLGDVIKYLEKSYTFSDKSVYLEIGCGPAYVGEYILSHYNGYFVGIDFNYEMLVTLKHYFDEKGYKKYILICDDINNMPLKDNSVDFIYGGGVIEHFKDTNNILKESYRVLKTGGVSFNTVPAFNLWWILRFYNNIPDILLLRQILEFIHLKLLKGQILERYYGYELSYTLGRLKKLHQYNNFREIKASSFAIHPSQDKSINPILDNVYYILQNNIFTGAVYMVYGKK
jgi:ubiquinone/menaquinone biosynthesis C-methylase UbiE